MMVMLKEEEDKSTPLLPPSEKNTNKTNMMVEDQDEPHVSLRSPDNKSINNLEDHTSQKSPD